MPFSTVFQSYKEDGRVIPYSTFLAPCGLNFFRVAANFEVIFFSFKRTF